MFRKKYTWAVCYGLLLAAFTVYAALDTFVIRRAYTVVEDSAAQPAPTAAVSITEAPQATAESSPAEPDPEPTEEPVSTEPVITESSYADGNITITITEYRQYDTSIYVADVTVSSAEYLKTAFAENTYGRNVTAKTSEIADSVGAILAINGDYYGSQESGYVLRNGVLYRSLAARSQEDLVIYADGSFEIITESAVTAETLLAQGAAQILSFGPALVESGAISVTPEDEVGKAKTSNPRTAIGIVDELHYLLVVSDGRTEESAGLTLYELAEFMQSLGAETAYNLDGGGSSTMVFNGTVVNNPTSSGRSIKERSVSDIVYIGY
ncbi:MAG: phosphodiester glycosidase family protein [Oscillospiraceae bacterium]|nr:phosphodiester glycosidase family protein [Oscillospiraceae bacterium]